MRVKQSEKPKAESRGVKRALDGKSAGANGNAPSSEAFYELVDELAERLRAGEAVDCEAYLQAHPQHAERLRQIWPSLAMLAALGNSREDSESVAPILPEAPDLKDGVLGDFRIVREIGRGGMGVVYEAEQISLGRRVALKVLPYAAMLDERQLQRFKNESRAAAGLHHPNIVPIHSVGCERGVHYYAMQYIEGQTLAEVIAQLRHEHNSQSDNANELRQSEPDGSSQRTDEVLESLTRGTLGELASTDSHATLRPVTESRSCPQSNVDTKPITEARAKPTRRPHDWPRTVARLGAQIAQALDYAHGMGIVHRDVKPANLIVDCRGKVWVTDFGLAQIENGAAITMTSDVLGTLRYMSPEQALGRRGILDHRADIYSLGVTLYELLTLQPAFAEVNHKHLLRTIVEGEPAPMSKLLRNAPRDLETIILKAISKDSAARYGSAGEMSDDLERFLRHEPILARRPSLPERIAKWSRRHVSLVWATAVSLLVCVVVLTIGVYQTRAARDKADENAQQAQQSLEDALAAVDQMLTRVAEETLFNEPRMTKTRRALLTDALKFYEEFAKRRQNDPLLERQIIQAYLRIGNIQMTLGESGPAIEAFGEAARRIALSSEFDVHDKYELAMGRFAIGHAFWYQGHYDESGKQFRQSIEILDDLIFSNPDVPNYRLSKACVLRHYGYVRSTIDLAEACAMCQQGAEICRALLLEFPDDVGCQCELANLAYSQGDFEMRMNNLKSAYTSIRNALKLQERASGHLREDGTFSRSSSWLPERMTALGYSSHLHISSQYRWELSRSKVGLARVLTSMRRYDEAERFLREGLSEQEKIVSDFPDIFSCEAELSGAYFSLGALLSETGRGEPAREAFKRAAELLEPLPPFFNGIFQNMFAWRLITDAQWTPSPAEQRLALSLARSAVTQQPQNGAFWNTLGVAQYRAGHWDAAISALTKSTALLGENPYDCIFLAMVYWQLQNYDLARQWLSKAETLTPLTLRDNELIRFREEAEALMQKDVQSAAHDRTAPEVVLSKDIANRAPRSAPVRPPVVPIDDHAAPR